MNGDRCPLHGEYMDMVSTKSEWVNYCRLCNEFYNRQLERKSVVEALMTEAHRIDRIRRSLTPGHSRETIAREDMMFLLDCVRKRDETIAVLRKTT